MIYQLESINRTINKIIRDLGLGQNEIPYQDFIEWISDALEHIGSYYQYEEKEQLIMIDDYEGFLPCDFYKQIRLRRGCEVVAGETGFYGGTLVSALNKAGVDYESLPAYERYRIVNTAGLSKGNQIDDFELVTRQLNFNKNLIGDVEVNKFTNRDFNINFNKITTSFRHGFLQLQYLAMPVDKDGFPMVPDHVSFREALFWHVTYRLSIRDPSIFKNPRLQDSEYCRQKWSYYCGQARAEANMPDLDMAIRLKNNWLRLYNRTDMDLTDFRDSGKQQIINLDGFR